MQLTFLNFIVIKTSAFDNINLLSNSNDIYLHPSKLKPRANKRNFVGSCWPTMLRPFGRGFSLLVFRYTSLELLNKLMLSKALVIMRMKLRNAQCLLVHLS